MREIELKILELPKAIFLKKMRELGAKKVHAVHIRIRYFDYPDGRIRAKKDLMRIRELTPLGAGKRGAPRTEVVYKIYQGIKGGCKVFDELEFELVGKESFEKAGEFLRRLGLVQKVAYEKKRTLFAYRHWKFEFDEHPKIPSFLEIEAEDAKEVHKIVKRLGLDAYETTPETITEVLARKYPQLKLQDLVFPDARRS